MSLNVFRMIELAGGALNVQRTRLEVASSNLANAHTTRTADGGPYQRRDVVIRPVPPADEFGSMLSGEMEQAPHGVEVKEIVSDDAPPRMVYDPGHPDANPDGYVAFPNINSVEEMVNMITIMRSYQANLAAFSSIRDMARAAMRISSSSV